MEYLEELFGLEGKVAAITGGGGVLCGTMARALGRLGVKVAVLDISEEAARKVAEDVEAKGGEALPLKCDVTDRGSLEEAKEGTLERFGKVDFLINCLLYTSPSPRD